MRFPEQDKVQCQAIRKDKKRCERIATHCCGTKALCHEHNQIAIRDKINAKPISR